MIDDMPAKRYLAEHRDGRTPDARTLDTLLVLMLEQWGAAADRDGLQSQLDQGGDGIALIAADGGDVLVPIHDREHMAS
jgi:hypothetical protein